MMEKWFGRGVYFARRRRFDHGVCFGRQRSGTGRIRGMGEIENQSIVFCIIGFYVLSGFRRKKIRIFFFNF